MNIQIHSHSKETVKHVNGYATYVLIFQILIEPMKCHRVGQPGLAYRFSRTSVEHLASSATEPQGRLITNSHCFIRFFHESTDLHSVGLTKDSYPEPLAYRATTPLPNLKLGIHILICGYVMRLAAYDFSVYHQ